MEAMAATTSITPEQRAQVAVAAVLPAEGFVKLPEILRVFPVSPSTWWAGVKSGRYPAGVKIGPKARAWRVEDIRKLIADAR